MVDWAIVTLLYLGINSYGWITSWLLVIGHIHGEDGLFHGHGVVEHEHVDRQGLAILPSKTRSHPSKRSGGRDLIATEVTSKVKNIKHLKSVPRILGSQLFHQVQTQAFYLSIIGFVESRLAEAEPDMFPLSSTFMVNTVSSMDMAFLYMYRDISKSL